MTNSLLTKAANQAAAASPSDAAAMADVEGAKLGAAAERKRQEEATDSLAAALASHSHSGKGVSWKRRIRANGEVRHVVMYERDGAYSERGFLSLCAKAARSAGKGRLRWDGEAVDSIAAELCVSILATTGGRMPRKGTLGRREGFEDADAAYLTTCAGRIIAQALKGEKRRAGLNAEIEPMAAADGADLATGADLLAAAVSAAESEPDRYMAESAPTGFRPVADWTSTDWDWAEALADKAARVLTPDARWAIGRFADQVGERPAAVTAAIVAALREREQAADLATAGHAASAGAFRKAAATGRGILREVFERVPTTAEQAAETEALADALSQLCAIDTAEREPRHISEQNGPAPYRGASLEWRERTTQPEDEPRSISAADLAAYPGA